MTAVISVLVVENRRMAARAHASFINRVPGFRATAVAGSAAAGLRRLATGTFDLVVLDWRLPAGGGAEFVRQSAGLLAPAQVVALCEPSDAAELAALGVWRRLTPPFGAGEVRDLLLAGVGEERLQSPIVSAESFTPSPMRSVGAGRLARLTRRGRRGEAEPVGAR